MPFAVVFYWLQAYDTPLFRDMDHRGDISPVRTARGYGEAVRVSGTTCRACQEHLSYELQCRSPAKDWVEVDFLDMRCRPTNPRGLMLRVHAVMRATQCQQHLIYFRLRFGIVCSRSRFSF